jgi:hypothetical protein
MNAGEWPIGTLIAGLAGAVAIATALCVYVMIRMPLERRARFARFLGKAFLVLAAGAMLLAMIRQFGR